MFLNYFLTILITSLALPLGILLAFIAPEELKPGEQYFRFARKALYVAAILATIYFQQHLLFIALIVIAGMIFYLQFFQSKYLSVFFVALLVVAKSDAILFPLLAVGIFLFFMIEGTLFAIQEKVGKKRQWKLLFLVLLEYWPFFLALPLYFLQA
ncbi:hypothetical protein HYS48_05255 [Candidatus Woesearchaeota archaeon]|nr:hypothetical protein [Candidatus Woesearchaeota archaeon]